MTNEEKTILQNVKALIDNRIEHLECFYNSEALKSKATFTVTELRLLKKDLEKLYQ